jgi:ATP-dependent Clp protease ATP-binding subunit ClpB
MLIKEKIETTRFNVEKNQLAGNFTQASKLLYIEIPKLEKELLDAEKTLKSKGLIRDSVTNIEIGEVISKSTGIPLNKIVEDEKEKLLKLTDEMQVHVKGQEQTLKLISNAVLRNRAGINDPNKPIGSFLFLGPTGVGKTEVARSLAFCLFDNYKSMVRLDMSEYMEKHSISKLIGAPPGYVGYEQAGALTESVRRKPYSVVLFDEIEKAHPDVLNLLLQILDDGSIKDSQGRVVNFKNTIIIMTSNIGATAVLENKPEEALEELKGYLKPEFINRIDEISIFNSLSDEVIIKIISKMLNDLSNRLKENQYNVEFDETIKKQIQLAGFDPLYGARPLKRYIQSNVENKLAEKIIDSEIKKETNYLVSYDDKNKNIEIKEK